MISPASKVARGPKALTERTLARAVEHVCALDRDLDRVVAEFGTPPLWARAPGFATLVHIILEQQVSLASARAAFARLRAALTTLTPRSFLTLDDQTLKTIGFSRQKIIYVRHLAEAINTGALDLDGLARLPDEAARGELLKLKGIGSWTADVYLLMALCRPDVFPSGDLGLLVAAQHVKQLPARPTPTELEILGERWRPWRAVAARILWHYYLSTLAARRPRAARAQSTL
jgi:DNA-3-methyladenine glycosylase II